MEEEIWAVRLYWQNGGSADFRFKDREKALSLVCLVMEGFRVPTAGLPFTMVIEKQG